MSLASETTAEEENTGEQASAPQSSQVEPPPWHQIKASPQWLKAVRQTPGLKPFFDNLESFVELPEGVEKLREMILHIATHGYFDTGDESDESADTLLAEVAEQRERLKQDKKVKSKNKLHPKAKSAPPFSIPDRWKWVRFWDVIWCFRGHNPPKEQFVESPRDGYVRFVQITDFKTDSRAVYVPESPKLKRVYKDEIIMAAYRHIGKLSRSMEGAFNVALCKVNEIAPMSRDFVEFLIGTDLVRGELLRASERGHIPSMHSDHLLSLWVPVPP